MVEYSALISPAITIIAGILILAFPNMLKYLLGAYLVLLGILNMVMAII